MAEKMFWPAFGFTQHPKAGRNNTQQMFSCLYEWKNYNIYFTVPTYHSVGLGGSNERQGHSYDGFGFLVSNRFILRLLLYKTIIKIGEWACLITNNDSTA